MTSLGKKPAAEDLRGREVCFCGVSEAIYRIRSVTVSFSLMTLFFGTAPFPIN